MKPSPTSTVVTEPPTSDALSVAVVWEHGRAWLSDHPERVRHEALGYAVAVGSIIATSLVIDVIQRIAHVSNISLLYLLAVIVLAWRFGSGPSIFSALLAFMAYDWFFIRPYHTFTVNDPAEWVSLLALFATGLVISQLTAQTRRREQEAVRGRERITTLYDLVQHLASDAPTVGLAQVVTARTLATFTDAGMLACTLFLPDVEGHLQLRSISVAPVPDAERIPLDAPEQFAAAARVWASGVPERVAIATSRVRDAEPHFTWDVPLVSNGERVGVLGITGHARLAELTAPRAPLAVAADATPTLFAAVTAQMALALDRAALQREAIQATALRETDRLRSALLGSITHDLRTPIAAIRTAAGSLLLPDTVWDDASRDEMLTHILNSSERLARMVDNILILSRLEAGAATPQKTPYLVEDIIDTVLSQLEQANKTSQHAITVIVPGEGVLLAPMDHAEIERVLLNLVENAIKYSPPASSIEIDADQPDDHTIEVRVIDHGLGIPESERHAIFDKFYRLKRALPWDPDQLPAGTGLGLTISEGIIRAHGGAIWVEETPGGGATFAFTLPTTPELSAGDEGEAANHE
ncbi:MAG: DUF4118 domain-containing protein [Ktedonobacterales bacterium]|nr:DUF4118 domain-containing protein [Ktedonobacterales bacterium]